MKRLNKTDKIAVIGLGYVGLPLAIEFSKLREVIGFDKNLERVNELKKNFDRNKDITPKQLRKKKKLKITSNINELKKCNFFIITVPTPVDKSNNPDFQYLIDACNLVGGIIKIGDIVIFESTVYPGVTEEICAPIIEKKSGLKFNKDFFCGYSPERINPGDKKNTLTNIRKITAGSNLKTSKIVDQLYKEIIKAGTFLTPSIKVAEAAKVIENTQRDLNIALINELAIIFNIKNIRMSEVLKAAETKWNFISFKPGLVGGHCIGVDPYYLAHMALQSGYNPEVILSGRRINDSMAKYVSNQVIKLMINKGINIKNSNVLVLGTTFKENCSDIRNSKVFDIIKELKSYKIKVDIFDPLANEIEVKKEYNLKLTKKPKKKFYDTVILAVPHDIFVGFSVKKIKSFVKKRHIFYDVKNILPSKIIHGALY